MTVQGVGAALSPAIGGGIAQVVRYHAGVLVLGSFALGSLALWLGFRGSARTASDVAPQPLAA
jgi:hypothetical protein